MKVCGFPLQQVILSPAEYASVNFSCYAEGGYFSTSQLYLNATSLEKSDDFLTEHMVTFSFEEAGIKSE